MQCLSTASQDNKDRYLSNNQYDDNVVIKFNILIDYILLSCRILIKGDIKIFPHLRELNRV